MDLNLVSGHRWKGIHQQFVVSNEPNDHPHGGEGKAPVGRKAPIPWGKPALWSLKLVNKS